MNKYILGDIFQGNFPVSQGFGANPSYYSQYQIYGVQMKGHEGVDFATPVGTPITAPFDGIILREDFQADFKNYGKVVVLWSKEQRCAVWFCHLEDENTTFKQSFKKGMVLGHTGNTGNTTGPHLHFGLVETDEYGNRLHANDGFGGFIDPLGSQVEWQLGGTIPQYIHEKLSLDHAVSMVNEIKTAKEANDPNFKANMQAVKDKLTEGLGLLQ